MSTGAGLFAWDRPLRRHCRRRQQNPRSAHWLIAGGASCARLGTETTGTAGARRMCLRIGAEHERVLGTSHCTAEARCVGAPHEPNPGNPPGRSSGDIPPRIVNDCDYPAVLAWTTHYDVAPKVRSQWSCASPLAPRTTSWAVVVGGGEPCIRCCCASAQVDAGCHQMMLKSA